MSPDNRLVALADRCDKLGLTKQADLIDSALSGGSFEKTAQYVGAVGYALRQHRAMGNCIRKKRATSKSPQDAVMSCLDEYQEGMRYEDETWAEKYAQAYQSYLDEIVKTAAANGIDPVEAVERALSVIWSENDISSHVSALSQLQVLS